MKDRKIGKMLSINIALLDEVELYLDQNEGSFSEFVRGAIREKLDTLDINVKVDDFE